MHCVRRASKVLAFPCGLKAKTDSEPDRSVREGGSGGVCLLTTRSLHLEDLSPEQRDCLLGREREGRGGKEDGRTTDERDER